jgi:hypothetical protein
MKFSGDKKGRYQRDDSHDAKPRTTQCEYVTGGGIRCRQVGGISSSTHGGGPWFCRDHFNEQGTRFADEIVDFSYQGDVFNRQADWHDKACEERMKQLGLPTKMDRDDAVAILAKSILGRALLKNIGRELKPRVNLDDY